MARPGAPFLLIGAFVLGSTFACGGGSPTSPTSTTPSARPQTAEPTPRPPIATSAPSPTISPSPTASASEAIELPAGAIWVPGTHVAIVPPPGYVPSTTFTGFEQEAGTNDILVNELPADPFDTSDANLARGGYVVRSRERSTRAGQTRQVFDGEQTIDGKASGRMVLSLGPKDTSALVIADYPLGDLGLRDRLRAALESVVLDSGRRIEPGVAMTFDVTPVAPLRLAGLLGTSAMYNTIGFLHPLDSLVPTMNVRPMDEDPPADAAAYLEGQLDGMRQQLLPGISLPPIPTTIGGVAATQLVATAMDNLHDMNRRIFVYQVLLVHPDGNRWVHFSAVATQAVQSDLLPAFQATAQSFVWRKAP